MQPYIRRAAHEVLCQQEYLTLCGDLTGRPVSAYSSTYPPDAVFGYMANQLEKGHQAGFGCQFPMPLFQNWEQQWPVSSKEQVSALTAEKDSQALIDALFAQRSCLA
jgi:hypothetical protein